MRQRWLLAILVVILVQLSPTIGATQESGGLEPVIVVFHAHAPFDSFRYAYRTDDRAMRDPEAWNYLDQDVVGTVIALERLFGFRADHVYSVAIQGFAARLNNAQINALRGHRMVSYVVTDNVMTTQAQTLPWGIDRIDTDQSSTVAGDGTGVISNVNVYIIDTGIDTAHADLNVVAHLSFHRLGLMNFDCNGHGTHVAGTAAAIDNTEDVVGGAPGAPLTGIKVLGCLGSGNTSSIVKGVDWVTANAQKPAVANMSLGGGANQALDDAVLNSVYSGIFYAVAAGNDGADACNVSPARIGPTDGVMTVAATDINEQEADFSNYGNCVDVWAPGVDILSTALGGGTRNLSGTSMASPHVAGTAALFLSLNPAATPAQVESAIKGKAVNTGTTSKDGRPITRLYAGDF
jgi:subtilisin family serine protease